MTDWTDDELVTLFETMTVDQLRMYRAAIVLDLDHGADRAFCERRIAAIDRHLQTAPPSITCPRCGRTSFNTHDIAERYCGACHRFYDEGDAP